MCFDKNIILFLVTIKFLKINKILKTVFKYYLAAFWLCIYFFEYYMVNIYVL